MNYEGASGPLDFDEMGDVVTDYAIWRYDATPGTFTTVRTIDSTTLL